LRLPESNGYPVLTHWRHFRFGDHPPTTRASAQIVPSESSFGTDQV
jgi:hypothetical protein